MSEFIDGPINKNEGIDFSKAQKLPGGGSTCEIYKAISQRRKVFVKRLKPKFRNMPLYLSAFDKEFDIGISLNHKSLPQYREFHGDYIVMDFIDGKTLAEMIEENDLWLTKEKNVIRILMELLDVVDYLHQRNVVHCDIKPDNIMITHGNRNLMLIDLDKCYTDWFDDTSGSPSKFSLPMNQTGSLKLDFSGIADIAEKIVKSYPELNSKRLNTFIKRCREDQITIDNLIDILKKSNNKYPWPAYLIGICVLVLVSLVITGIIIWRPKEEPDETVIQSSLPTDTITIYKEILKTERENVGNKGKAISADIKPKETSVNIKDGTKEMTMEEKGKILDEKYMPFVKKLNVQLEQLQQYQNDTTLTYGEMLDYIRDFADGEDNFVTRMWQLVQENFPETHETDVADQIQKSRVYREYMHRSDSIQKSYSAEMDKRRRDARK